MNKVVDFEWLTYKEIVEKLDNYIWKKVPSFSMVIPIPKAANVFLYPLLVNSTRKDFHVNRILVVDVICDSGKTFEDVVKILKLRFPYHDIVTLAIITKDPTKVDHYLYRIPEELHDKWFFGFGMDLVSLKNSTVEPYRDFPNIGWCTRYCPEDRLHEHPIFQILKSVYGEAVALRKLRKVDDMYDLSSYTVLTRDSGDDS